MNPGSQAQKYPPWMRKKIINNLHACAQFTNSFACWEEIFWSSPECCQKTWNLDENFTHIILQGFNGSRDVFLPACSYRCDCIRHSLPNTRQYLQGTIPYKITFLFFIFKILKRYKYFLWGHWCPYRRLLVTFALGFKSTVDHQIHSWFNTYYPIASIAAHAFWSSYFPYKITSYIRTSDSKSILFIKPCLWKWNEQESPPV